MHTQAWQLIKTSIAFTLALALCAACVPGGSEDLTPEATGAAPALATLTPTPTVLLGGGAGEATPEPTSIPLCPDLALEIEFQQVQFMQVGETSIENLISASGRVPLSVDLGMSPPKVSGEGELPVSGGGHAGDCAFQNSGDLAYRFDGEIVTGPDGYPELHLRGQRSMNVVVSGPCGGGATTPFEDIGEQVLAYENGHTLAWNWEVGAAGVTGNSNWVLHILCEE